MRLQRGTEISAPLSRLVPLQEEDRNLSLPGPSAICNYPNPALHLPCNLPDLQVKNGALGMYCNSGFKKQICYMHSIPALLQHFREQGEQRQRKARLGVDKLHRYHSPIATPASTSVTLCHHKLLDLQYINLLIRLSKCHVCFLRRAIEWIFLFKERY